MLALRNCCMRPRHSSFAATLRASSSLPISSKNPCSTPLSSTVGLPTDKQSKACHHSHPSRSHDKYRASGSFLWIKSFSDSTAFFPRHVTGSCRLISTTKATLSSSFPSSQNEIHGMNRATTKDLLETEVGSLNQDDKYRMKDLIYFYIQESYEEDAPDLALELVERLCQEDLAISIAKGDMNTASAGQHEEDQELQPHTTTTTSRLFLKPAIIFDTIKKLQRQTASSYRTLDRINNVLHYLERLPHAYDTKIPYYMISAMAKCKNSNAALEADGLLKRLEGLCMDGGSNNIQQEQEQQYPPPLILHYNFVLQAYALRGNTKRCKGMLQRMHEGYKMGILQQPPDCVSYTALLKCLQRHRRGKEAFMVLDEMKKLYSEGVLLQPPDRVAYNTAMQALSRDRSSSLSSKKDTTSSTQVQLAEQLLEEMEQSDYLEPNETSYNSMLTCYARCGMTNQAEELVERMNQWYKEGLLDNGPSVTTYNCLLHAYANDPSISLTASMDNKVDDSSTMRHSSSASSAVSSAEELYQRMKSGELNHDVNITIQPDHITCNTLLQCYARNGQGEKAEELLQEMEALHQRNMIRVGPQRISFLHVIRAVEKSGDSERAKLLEEKFLSAKEKKPASSDDGDGTL